MMRKLILTAALLTGLSGCNSFSDHLLIESDPVGATITFSDGRSCTTPCPIAVTNQARVTVAKAGYTPKQYDLFVGNKGRYFVKLELSAPTMDVEASALPDL